MIGLLAVIELGFDPLHGLGPLTVRWQTIGVTIGLLIALAVAALLIPRRPTAASEKGPGQAPTLEQMLLILVGIVPGAVVGGRIVHVLDYLGAYAANPLSAMDPNTGSLSLLGAVLGGTLSAIYVCRLLRAPVNTWAAVAVIPFLLALGLGKFAQLLGGAGQGVPTTLPWAVAFVGDGPWISLAPSIPSHPSQVYEAVWLLAGIPVLLVLGGARRKPSRTHPYVAWADRVGMSSALFVGAVAWFLLGRFVVGFTWRDPTVVGPLNMEQFLALVILVVGGAFLWARRGHLPGRVALVLCLVLVAGCGSTTSPVTPTLAPPTATPSSQASPSPMSAGIDIDALVSQMTVDEKIGQLFMVDFYGDVADETNPEQVTTNQALLGADNISQAIARYHLGGVIYFTWAGNLVSGAQIAKLSNSIQAAGAVQQPSVPLLIGTDQEGGSVVRLPSPATAFPGNMALGATGQPDLARAVGKAMGEELRALGINDVLAPVGDVNVNPANPIIGLRSFGSDPGAVAGMAAAMIHGFQDDARLGATIKHFPGHGDTDIDSHSQLPVIDHSMQQWAQIDEPPFVAALGAGVDSVMVGHLAFPALDSSGTPASLSHAIVGDILRGQLGFDDVVITDGLDMGALRDTYGDDRIPVMAIEAGDDILLMPPRLPVAYAAVQAAVRSGEISPARLDDSVRRILALKAKLGLFGAQPVDVSAANDALGTSEHHALETTVARDSVTLLANDGNFLPISSAQSSRSYLVVGPVAAPVAELGALLAARGLTVGTYVTGALPSASIAAAAAARAGIYGGVIDLTLNADTDVGQQRVVGSLAATGKPLVTVSIGRPYDQGHYRAAINVCLYSDSAASLRALVRALFGEIDTLGRLPVAIPDPAAAQRALYPLGYGLSYTVNH